jgi:YhcH/YjgK/YiaL family protein
MIVDHLSNASAFAALPQWPQIAAFLDELTLAPMAAGRHDIDGDNLYAIIADDVHKMEQNPLEAHRLYIDVQVAIEGSFDVLWRPLAHCQSVMKEYDAEKDYLLMADAASSKVHLEPGIAAVFYPEDAHAPQPPASIVRKVVFKVKVG